MTAYVTAILIKTTRCLSLDRNFTPLITDAYCTWEVFDCIDSITSSNIQSAGKSYFDCKYLDDSLEVDND